MIERVAITGSSGYYGRHLIARLRSVAPAARILGIDRSRPETSPPDEFHGVDIRDAAARDAIVRFRPDTIVHLAFALAPLRDERQSRAINVGGAMNVFDAVRAVRPRRFQCCSSATVYGALPDNPVPVDESWPVRACGTFRYALDKVHLEGELTSLARELPDVAVSWTRPAVICGPGIRNHIFDALLKFPIVFLPDGRDVPMQFVHVDDLVAATYEILARDARGPFNVGPPDWITLGEIAKMTNRRRFGLPFRVLRFLAAVGWTLRLPPTGVPPGFVEFLRYPWVAAPRRLQDEFGFEFHHASRDMVAARWREHVESQDGRGGPTPTAPAETTVPGDAPRRPESSTPAGS